MIPITTSLQKKRQLINKKDKGQYLIMKHHKIRSIAEIEKLIKQKENELFELQVELQQAEDLRQKQTKRFLKKDNTDSEDW